MIFRPRRQYALQANWGRAFGAFSVGPCIMMAFFFHRRHIIDLDSFLFVLSSACILAIIAIDMLYFGFYFDLEKRNSWRR